MKNHLGCWKNTLRIRKSLACSSWFTNSSRVLPTSHVVYQPINHKNLWSIAQLWACIQLCIPLAEQHTSLFTHTCKFVLYWTDIWQLLSVRSIKCDLMLSLCTACGPDEHNLIGKMIDKDFDHLNSLHFCPDLWTLAISKAFFMKNLNGQAGYWNQMRRTIDLTSSIKLALALMKTKNMNKTRM